MNLNGQNDAKRRKPEKYLTLLLENTQNAILILDDEARVMYCSKKFLGLMKIEDFRAIKGRGIIGIYSAIGGSEFAAAAEKRLENVKKEKKTTAANIEIRFPGTDEERFYTVHETPMRNAEECLEGILVSYNDTISSQTEAETRVAGAYSGEMKFQAAGMEAAAKAKNRFLASVSNEIRKPMNAIIGMSELIRTDNLDETQRKYFEDIRDTSRSLLQIINDILDSSKIEAEVSENSKPENQTDMSSAPSDETEVLFTQLSQINDLQVFAGLARLNRNKDAYVNMLRQFCNNLDDKIQDILSRASSKDWKEYSVRLHAIKNVFANLGNNFLADWAFCLEKASNDGNTETCEKQTKPFCGDMLKFRNQLLNTSLMEETATFKNKRKISAGNLIWELEKLETVCLECDTAVIGEVIRVLKKMTFNAKIDSSLEEIFRLADSFDYDEVIAKCGVLLQTLSDS